MGVIQDVVYELGTKLLKARPAINLRGPSLTPSDLGPKKIHQKNIPCKERASVECGKILHKQIPHFLTDRKVAMDSPIDEVSTACCVVVQNSSKKFHCPRALAGPQ